MSIFEYMKCTTFLLWLFVSCSAFAQNEQIAKDFFEKGDYEKALASYEGLYKKQRRLNYFIRIIGCHQQLEQFEKAGNLLNRELNKRSIQPQLYIELGYNYQLQNNMPEAEKSYAQALQLIQENPNYAYTIGRSFEKYNLLDYAITCYQDASALNERLNFSFNIARIYGEQGKIEQMFSNYLDLMSTNETYTSAALRNINQYLTEDPQNEANILFKKVLLKKLQSEPNSLWNEQLSWLYVQQKEFKKAFIQEKALYKRRPESLQRIINIAEIAMQTEANEAASKILSFIATTSQIKQTQLFAKRYLLQIQVKNAKKQEYQAIASQYAVLLKEFSAQTEAYNVAIDYAHFLAFYNEKTPEAVAILKEQLDRPLSKLQKASIKMELADILVLEQKFNQALIIIHKFKRN